MSREHRRDAKTPPRRTAHCNLAQTYSVDSISNPQASNSASGMYFEFLFRRAHSRSRVERTYWSGVNLYSFTTCSKDVTVGTTGPIGSGLPQFGFPRRFAILSIPHQSKENTCHQPTIRQLPLASR